MKTIRFFSSFWGDKYLDMFRDVMFKTLFLPKNIPMMEDKELIFDIYCMESEKKELQNLVENNPDIDFNFYTQYLSPDNLTDMVKNRELFKTLKVEMKKAFDDESIIVMALPDEFFGNGLNRVIDSMKPKDYVVCTLPRISYENGFWAVRDIFKNKNTLSIADNKYFVDLVMRQFPHPMVRYGLGSKYPYLYKGNKLVWFGKEYKGYYEVHYCFPTALCFYPTMPLYNCPQNLFFYLFRNLFPFSIDSMKQYYFSLKNSKLGLEGKLSLIDHEFLDIVHFKKYIKMITDSRFFFWSEFATESNDNPTATRNTMTKASQYLKDTKFKLYK